MPLTPEALRFFREKKVEVGPGKAANAGGVAVSGLEMVQSASRWWWTREEVDNKLKVIMKHIHEQCVKYGEEDAQFVNYAKGANIAGYERVARAMLQMDVI